MTPLIEQLTQKRISIAPLITFRVLFGFIMMISLIRFAAYGWIHELYIAPDYYFSYTGLDWVKPFEGVGMYLVFLIMFVSSAGIFLGLFYHLSSIIFFLTFTYVELIDKTNYLNHYYFVSLIAFLLIFVPANKSWSLDIHRKSIIKTAYVPAWTINIFKLQLIIVYFFAGLAKINPYWLFEAMPLKIWLPAKSHLPVLGPLFQFEWVAFLFSWAGMFYDLTIAFFLLIKKTRLAAYIAVVIFHLLTAFLFQIGMFPFIMILSALIFFSAERHIEWQTYIRKIFDFKDLEPEKSQKLANPSPSRFIVTYLLIPFFVLQILIPFRSHAYPGDLFWTEQGYRFSWRVMLMEKAGFTTFRIEDDQGKTEWVDNTDYLSPQQVKMMSTQPDMILQFAHFLKKTYADKGFNNPKVFCESKVSLNGRRSQEFIDPTIDLGSIKQDFKHKYWITDFEK